MSEHIVGRIKGQGPQPAARETTMDELRAISTFVRAAELGSFNKVAQAQGTTPQAVSKSIRLLEHHLGVRLIHRTTRQSSLTEEGQRLFEDVRGSLQDLITAVERIRYAAKDDQGVIRVAARAGVGRRVLMPLITAFRQKHPAIEFDLLLSERDADIVADRIDVSLVAGAQPTNQVIARRLFALQEIVCASPEYLDSHPVPQTPEELKDHRCIGYRQSGTGKVTPWEFVGETRRVRHAVPLVLCCSDPEAELQAVESGIGIGRLSSIAAAQSMREGKLVPVLTDWMSENSALYLCYAQRNDMPARIRLFIDFAFKQLMNCRDFSLTEQELSDLAAQSLSATLLDDKQFDVLRYARAPQSSMTAVPA